MIELLLPLFETSTDLSESRLRLLDGTIHSWTGLLKLFYELLPLTPNKVLCVINGFHWLDDRSTLPYLDGFLDTLRGSNLRVLFTTNGRSGSLRGKLDPSETVLVESLDLQGSNWQLDRNNSWAN